MHVDMCVTEDRCVGTPQLPSPEDEDVTIEIDRGQKRERQDQQSWRPSSSIIRKQGWKITRLCQ